MIDPTKYIVGPDAVVEDVDLEQTEIYSGGKRLTEERAAELAEQTLEEIRRRNLVPGGKSLSGENQHSPTVQFRVPTELRAKLTHQASVEGISTSKLARKALEQYLASHKAG